jgi:hypothetical protein
MKIFVREAAAGDLDDIPDWISSIVAQMRVATSAKEADADPRLGGARPDYAGVESRKTTSNQSVCVWAQHAQGATVTLKPF